MKLGIERTKNFLYWAITRPLTGFFFYLGLIAFVIYAPRKGGDLIVFFMVLPWLLLIAIGLNMSFVALIFRQFTFSESIKKNHAIEHGTIVFLRRRYGGKARFGGSAESDGFRICGVQKEEHLLRAFEELLKELKIGNSRIIISMRCGSNIGTAQGFGILLLTITGLLLLLFNSDHISSMAALIMNVLIYFLLRTRLGNWFQSKFFMSLDFSQAKIRSIYKVKKKIFWERDPVYFVKTAIS